MYNSRDILSKARTKAQVRDLLRGLDLVPPGVALVHRWPDNDPRSIRDSQVSMYGGVAVKR